MSYMNWLMMIPLESKHVAKQNTVYCTELCPNEVFLKINCWFLIGKRNELIAKNSRKDQTNVSSSLYHQSSCTPMTAGSRTGMQTKYLNPTQEQSTQTVLRARFLARAVWPHLDASCLSVAAISKA